MGCQPSGAACSQAGPSRVHKPYKPPVWVAALSCSHMFSFSLPAAVVQQVFPSFKYIIPEALPPRLMGSVWPAASLSPNQLEMALLYVGKAYCSFSQSHLCSSLLPCSQNLAMQTQYKVIIHLTMPTTHCLKHYYQRSAYIITCICSYWLLLTIRHRCIQSFKKLKHKMQT